MRGRVLFVSIVAGIFVLAGAGVGIAAVLGAFSSPTTATTATPGAGGSYSGARGGFGDGGGGLGGGRAGGGGIFGSFGAAATYLGVSTDQLFTDLRGGQTLAAVAKTQGKSVSGLVDAMVSAEKQSLASAVSSGQLTQAQEQQIEANLQSRITSMVNGSFGRGGLGGGGLGGGGGQSNTGPPAGLA